MDKLPELLWVYVFVNYYETNATLQKDFKQIWLLARGCMEEESETVHAKKTAFQNFLVWEAGKANISYLTVLA